MVSMPSETVSIIVPCYNEEATIALLLDAIANQSYPRTLIEVVIADGMSIDGTERGLLLFKPASPI